MKAYVVVAYDISDDRRRERVAKILEGYGERVQYSVFECRLDRMQYLRLRHKLEEVIDRESDMISFYFLCETDVQRIERIGGGPPRFEEPAVIAG
ncbi:MAG: CRISPR-associated endonuclease Cas2 [Candidatus Bipolaricaulaceae bacterium]